MNAHDGALAFDAYIKNSDFKKQIDEMERRIQDMANKTISETSKMDDAFKRLSAGIAAYFSFQALRGFGQEIINVRGEFQQLEVAFETMLQSKEKADALMADVVKLAATTPFSLKEVATGAKQLLAIQVPASEIEDTLRRIGDVSAGLSVPMGQLIKAYGDVKSKGRLMGQEMLQFMGAGVPMVAELAKHFNVAENEISKMVEEGKVGFTDVQAVIKNLTNEGGIFANLMAKQSETIAGLVSNLGDAWARVLNDIGEGNQNFISGSIKGLITLVENYEVVLDILKVIAVSYGTYKAATIAATVATNGLTIAENLHYAALVIVEKAQKLLNKTMLANPYVALATVLAGIVTTLVVYKKRLGEVSEGQKRLETVNKKVSESYAQQKGEIDLLLQSARNETLTNNQRYEAINKIKEIIPEYNAELSEEGRLINENTAAIEAYLKQLEIKIKMTAVQDELSELWKQEREQLKLLEKAQADFNRVQARNKLPDVVSGGESGVAGAAAMADMVSRAEKTRAEAEKNLKATQDAINALKDEYKSSEKSLADFFTSQSEATERAIKTIKDLEDELSALEKRRKESTDIGDKQELDRLAKEIISKRQELEKFRVESRKTESKNELDIFKEDLSKKRELYAQFEAYRRIIGEDEAREMYADLLFHAEDYVSYLEKMLSSVSDGNKRAVIATELFSFNKNEANTVRFKLEDILKETATHKQKLIELEEEYIEKSKLLAEAGAEENLEILTKEYEKRRKILESNYELALESSKWIYDSIDKMGRRSLKEYIARLREEIAAKKWSDDVKLMLSEKLAEAEKKLNDSIPESLEDVAFAFKELAEFAGQFNDELAKSLDLVAGLAGDVANLAKSLAAGDYVGAAAASLGITDKLTTLWVDLTYKSKDFSSSINELAESFDLLLEGFNKLSENKGLSFFSENKRLIEEAKRQLEEYEMQHKQLQDRINQVDEIKDPSLALLLIPGFGIALYAKKKKEYKKAQEELQNLEEQIRLDKASMAELQRQIEEAEAAYNKALTGTTADEITAAIVDGLRKGETAAQVFSNNFGKMLEQSAAEFMKRWLQDKFLNKFYEDMVAALDDDGKFDAQEIADLQKQYKDAIIAGDDFWAQLTENFPELFNGMGDSLVGQVKGVTQETASAIVGQMNAIRIYQAEGLTISREKLLVLHQIASNTSFNEGIYNRLKTLTDIKEAISMKKDDLRAKGLTY